MTGVLMICVIVSELVQEEEVYRHIMTGVVTVCVIPQEEEVYEQRSAGLRQELEAMRAAAVRFDGLHRAAAAEVARLKEAQGLEQGQAHMLLKQGAALKRDNHLLKVLCRGGGWGGGECRSQGRDDWKKGRREEYKRGLRERAGDGRAGAGKAVPTTGQRPAWGHPG